MVPGRGKSRLELAADAAFHVRVRHVSPDGAHACADRRVTLLSDRLSIRWAVFVCLVYNPFVFDYLVAARGYGLAAAFLLCAIVTVARHHALRSRGEQPSLTRTCASASIFVALSFASNFAFAIADAVTFCMLGVWLFTSSPEPRMRVLPRIAPALVLPGLAVTLLLCGWTLLHWPHGQLTDGGNSLRDMLSSVREASLFQVNPELANPLILKWLSRLKQVLFPALFASAALLAGVAVVQKSGLDARARLLVRLASVIFAGLAVILVAHWIAFHTFHLLYPQHRMALFIPMLFFIAVGALAAIHLPSAAGKICRYALLGSLFATAVYFLFCLRLTYFKEWQWDADMKDAYSAMAYYNHAYCIEDVSANWLYTGSLMFYREIGHETFHEFHGDKPYPTDRAVYVLHAAVDDSFIRDQQLNVVYRGPADTVVAVRPAMLEAHGRACVAEPHR